MQPQQELLTNARELAAHLSDDIKLASTRIEHVRLTARANEAARLVEEIERLLTNEPVQS
jgi:hypothetical protein